MKRFLGRLKRWFPVRVASRYLGRNGANQATLIAWNLLFAFFPIMVLAVTLASLIPSRAGVGKGITAAIASALPGGRGEAVVKALQAFHQHTGALVIVGIVGLLWSGSSLFGAMDQAFAGLATSSSRSFVSQKLMSFGMIVLFSCLVVPVVLSSSLLAVVKSVPGIPRGLATGPITLLLQIVFSLVVGTILFGAIYFLVPKLRRSAVAVLPGAVTAAGLFEALSLLFPLYFKLAHGFSSYGSTFSLFFLILTYVFFMAQILVVGFAVVLEREASQAVAQASVQAPRPPASPAQEPKPAREAQP